MLEHKIEFEKLKEPEDQLAMESVRSNFKKKSKKTWAVITYMLKILKGKVQLCSTSSKVTSIDST